MEEEQQQQIDGLQRLHVERFRCITALDLEPHPRANLIIGANASGKTSLLEAIFFLGRGRSFRTSTAGSLVQDGSKEFVVAGRVSVDAHRHQVGVRGGTKGLDIRVDAAAARSVAALTEMLPVQIIDPDIHNLVEEGPERRRRFLDWGTFHGKRSFLEDWRRYRRALRQRNAALRRGAAPSSLAGWDQELVLAGELVSAARDEYVERLRPVVKETCSFLLGLSVDIAHMPGWDRKDSLEDVFSRNRKLDTSAAISVAGPHRADVRIRASDRAARRRVSRGQQKLLAAGLILAQLQELRSGQGVRGVLLVDDPVAELDARALPRLLDQVFDLDQQLFVTVLDSAALSKHDFDQHFQTADFDTNVSRETPDDETGSVGA